MQALQFASLLVPSSCAVHPPSELFLGCPIMSWLQALQALTGLRGIQERFALFSVCLTAEINLRLKHSEANAAFWTAGCMLCSLGTRVLARHAILRLSLLQPREGRLRYKPYEIFEARAASRVLRFL